MAIREPAKHRTLISLPAGGQLEQTVKDDEVVYTFPEGSEVRAETVGRWQFASVIAISVTFICLWGTIIGSMLPLIFHKVGFDPALASTPFVATFVDVSGIFCYFSIAVLMLF